MKKILYLLFLALSQLNLQAQDFVKVQNGKLVKDGKPYHYLGTNFWYGMNLAVSDKARLVRELDRLNNLGVKNLRIIAASEGNLETPWTVQPTMQKEPGSYNEELWKGLDLLLAEMKKRNMTAVVCLNNFWPWSGGFAQYVSWANQNEAIPYPPPAENGDWRKYQHYSARFYSDKTAQKWFENHIQKVVTRVNSVTKIPYKKDPTIMAWQLANEPEGSNNIEAYRKWIDDTAGFIKKLDPKHLVSIGSEGNTPSPENGTNFEIDHQSKNIDYCTFHLWVQNWGWFDPLKVKETYPMALEKAEKYIDEHVKTAQKLNKPLVLEEFGISRDENSYDANSSVEVRDQYYTFIFEKIYALSQTIPQVSGVNFWAWGGEGRPKSNRSIWKLGDDLVGDPPHEYQGWYSVYDRDLSTQKIINEYALKLNNE
ncbi:MULTISPECIES: cellulase family glycosylhydrolase [Flavobacterium]|uniref:mannan endo-1,4-beta-mannosidase n=1 Tax=Flavobacterium ginsengisoli TaxID=871694 RepID=A0ABP7FFH6_9FLAO|nr:MULTISPECIES: cellulase family glycosylhydrolase [Flavobacterium]MBJ2127280.1 cellulase family glycosylhydrolase [Flavobacterium sp. IB48]